MDRPLRRTVLRDEIKDRIVERILDGTYGPGDRIVESAVATEFGVSQAPVREALRDLEAMRFIESQPHRGARVRQVTVEELGQIYPVRAALEEVAGREAAARMTDEQLADLAAQLEGMRAAALAEDVHAQLLCDIRFHEIIVEASGNQVLVDVWRSLRVEARTLISVMRSDTDLHAIAEMHQPVLQALQFRDPELAGKEMRSHIEFFGASVVGRRND
ncbi:MAG: Transcriptional Regulator, GntR family [Modestobacter sp.]|nr:Transcriptional Regulator, GntR family [Modestobacter sp.]MCW2575989.1 Transcriptional Regulator, GntR family [Modestobacter sp.]MCW2616940.1 Transcriptional Regulator, GntR family [Modestobacter sp.]